MINPTRLTTKRNSVALLDIMLKVFYTHLHKLFMRQPTEINLG